MYGSYYSPIYRTIVTQPGVTPTPETYDPVVVSLDFTTTLSGNFTGSKYVIYDLPNATRSVTITYTNFAPINGGAYPEIDSATFNFEADGSQLVFKGNPVTEKYDVAYFSTYGIYQDSVFVSNNDVLQLTTTSPIRGRLFVGFYPAEQ